MNVSLKLPVSSILTFLFLALLLPVFGKVFDADGGSGFSQAPYQLGESLTYNVSYSNFPSVAHVQVQVVSRGDYAGRDSIQLRAHVKTTEIVSVALLAINNDYTTFIDPDSGQPIHSQVISHEITKDNESSRDFSQIADGSNQSNVSGLYDFLSAFYRIRALPLAVGSDYSLSVKGEANTYSVEVKVTDRQSVKTTVGSFNTLVAQVRTSSGLIKNARVYFSDDARHIPVMITAKVGTGELRTELAGSELLPPQPQAAPIAMGTPTPAPVSTPTPASRLPSTIVPTAEDWPFKVGEQLNYQLYLNQGLSVVGIATFQVRGHSRYFDQDGLWLSVKAQTIGPAQRLFAANDQIDSYVDPKSLLPYHTDFKLVEGRRRLNRNLTFRQDYGVITTEKHEKIEIPVGTHDYLSFFYAMRTFNVEPKRKNAISILVENKPKTLVVNSINRERIQLGDQRLPAISVTLTTDDPQSDKYQIRVWLSDDKRRLPLRISCVTELGPLQADLAILPTARQ